MSDATKRQAAVRPAAPGDLDGVAALYDLIHTEEEAGRTTIGWVRDVYPTKATAQEALSAGELFVMEEGGRIVAAGRINQTQVPEYAAAQWRFAAADEAVMVLHTLVVDPREKGRGYGSRFVSFYEDYAQSRGCPFLRLDTNVKNSSARGLYKKLGYWEVGVVPCVFNGINGVSLVCLEKKLPADVGYWVGLLSAKDNKVGFHAMELLVRESGCWNSSYPYLDRIAALLEHKNSLVRSRAIALIAANAKWDTQDKLSGILDRLLPHIADEKPITARQCVKALPAIAAAKPQLAGRIRAALLGADVSVYADSMAPLVQRDIMAALGQIGELP